MTTIHYRCKMPDGVEKSVSTLAEAKAIEAEGGTYEIAYDYNPSREVGFARKFSRVVPSSHNNKKEE